MAGKFWTGPIESAGQATMIAGRAGTAFAIIGALFLLAQLPRLSLGSVISALLVIGLGTVLAKKKRALSAWILTALAAATTAAALVVGLTATDQLRWIGLSLALLWALPAYAGWRSVLATRFLARAGPA